VKSEIEKIDRDYRKFIQRLDESALNTLESMLVIYNEGPIPHIVSADDIAKHPINEKTAPVQERSNYYKGKVGEIAVIAKCGELGYSVEPYGDSTIDLFVNGFAVEVKTPYQLFEHPTGLRYAAGFSKNQIAKMNFGVVYIKPANSFFVIPRRAIKKNTIHIPHPCNKRHKYSRYYNAWHLLEAA
jgi:hypothetical protein